MAKFNIGNVLGDVLGGVLQQTQLNGIVEKGKALEDWLMAVLYLSGAAALISLVTLLIQLFRKK